MNIFSIDDPLNASYPIIRSFESDWISIYLNALSSIIAISFERHILLIDAYKMSCEFPLISIYNKQI